MTRIKCLLPTFIAVVLAAMLVIPVPALAASTGKGGLSSVDAGTADSGSELSFVTLECTSCSLPGRDREYKTAGKYLLLASDGTGLFAHQNECYVITSWKLDGNNFQATVDGRGPMTGTVENGNVLSADFEGFKYKFVNKGTTAPIANLSPSTWYESLPYVVDEAGVLTADQIVELNGKAKAISEKYGCDVHLVVLGDMLDYSGRNNIDACAEEIAQGYKLGHGEGRDMIMLVMSMNDRDFSLVSFGPLGKDQVFTRDIREMVVKDFKDSFSKDKWYAGFNDYLNSVEKALECNETGVPITRPSAAIHIIVAILFSLLIAFIPAIIASVIIRSRNKSVRVANSAQEYAVPEGAEITFRSDTFSHTTQTRTYSPVKTDGGSSGIGGSSSFSSGSGFGHTSGKF